MKVNNAELETVCGITSRLPVNELPEIAFIGRSNVGKSSLINVLVNRKSLARTSQNPGKTQTINFYRIEKTLYFVDLPGYGYAKVSKEIKEKWGKMIERYLRTSKQLRTAFMLMDIRHEPSENDRIMYKWLISQRLKPVIIATKLDKIKRSQADKQLKLLRDGIGAAKDTLCFPFSALTRQGAEEIWGYIEGLLEEKAETED